MPPTSWLETGLAAGVIEKGLPVPSVLHRHLWEKQSARRPPLDQDSVSTDRDFIGCHPPQRREGGDLDVGLHELVGLQGFETRVFEGGGDSVVTNRSPERRDADHVADAASKAAVDLESDEGATLLEKDFRLRLGGWESLTIEPALNRAPRQR